MAFPLEQKLPSYLHVEPFPLQAGEEFQFQYNAADTGAPYRGVEHLVAGVSFATFDRGGMVHYRFPLSPGGERVFAARCRVPPTAYWAELWVAPPETPPYRFRRLSVVVFRKGRPQLGAFPMVMYTVEDSIVLERLFEDDERLYPSECWRWGARWRWLARHRYWDQIRREVDSVWREVRQHSLSGAAVCFYGFVLARRWDKAAEAGQALLERMEEGADLPWSLLADFLSHIWLILPAGDPQAERSAALVAALWARFPLELGAEKRLGDQDVVPELFHRKSLRHYRTILDGWARWFLAEGGEEGKRRVCGYALVAARRLLEWEADTVLAVRLLRRGGELVAGIPEENAPGCGVELALSVLEPGREKLGWTSSLWLELGKVLLAQNSPEGELWLRRVAELPLRDETRGAIFQACYWLGQRYAERQDRDSAVKYWAWMQQLNDRHPLVDSLWQQLRESFSLRAASRTTLIRRYPYASSRQPVPPIVTVDGKVLEPARMSKPTVLLFSSRECGLCKLWYPVLLAELAKRRLSPMVVVVSPDSVPEPIPSTLPVRYASLTRELSAAYQVVAFPTVVVVQGENVVYRGSLASWGHVQAVIASVR